MNLSDDQIYQKWSGGKRTYSMRASKTPCPGCGQVGKYRPADRVCLDCFKDLLEIEELRAKFKAEAEGAEALLLPWAPHYLPYVPHENSRRRNDEQPGIQDSFYALMDHLGKPTGGAEIDAACMIEPKRDAFSSGSWAEAKIYPKGTQKFARNLYDAILRLADASYKEGFERGDNLLANLARGEVTVKDYNAQVDKETSSKNK